MVEELIATRRVPGACESIGLVGLVGRMGVGTWLGTRGLCGVLWGVSRLGSSMYKNLANFFTKCWPNFRTFL